MLLCAQCSLLGLMCISFREILKTDFQDLFPDRDIRVGDLTVITLSQRTQNDMTSWSEHVEAEREQLLENVRTSL